MLNTNNVKYGVKTRVASQKYIYCTLHHTNTDIMDGRYCHVKEQNDILATRHLFDVQKSDKSTVKK